MSQLPLIRDKTAFSEAYLPAQFVRRSEELSKLRSALSPLSQGKTARNLWLYGPPGTGKTTAAKCVLNELEDKHGIRCIYANCWETPTYFSLLEKMIRDLRLLGAERLSNPYRMERIEKHLHARPLVIILDEVDKPSPKERDTIIYNLCAMSNVTLVCICNSRYFFLSLDRRIRSRLHPVLLEFKAFTNEDLIEILRDRADSGLGNGIVNDLVLAKIARSARGDARVAIQALLHSAARAERSRSTCVSSEDVDEPIEAGDCLKRKYLLAKLTDHHKVIYDLIQNHPDISSAQLWRDYLSSCRRARVRPAAARTYLLYLKTLSDLGLVSHRRALGVRGNVRMFRAC
jgi:Cdc6-like AAA superfamily ATPase